ncbi:hypothetical protein CEUSTIGMA_g3669.t1 [Chlamydomonas eustigma]|uniref:ARID domain-containing protein n=1 Tax=Chlamydomonas eustigma TaxID=1157962 RepID=A0A250WZL5_9CHLO|nr:hypothetical protein CEUSTIGMA_g3669.t1 [Chlamydomonas eustigma]|eukprot:GAX76225.1 hypothetical protein CEUSTIGMA_g3669.t1 [Chlamydomonas eustigma]
MAGWHINTVHYPVPSATHEQVIGDRELFYSTHENLLNHIGIKLKVPKVGGIEVDLHQLYKEVTSLGGLESVINRKQWVIVCEPFSFPASFTNKSFVIKKLYINALHHYEQVYYHRTRGPLVSAPTGPSETSYMAPVNSPASPSFDRTPKRKPESHSESMLQHVTVVPTSSNSGSPSAPSVSPDLRAGTRFTGVIDNNFENSYMITINLPNQRLQGVLYKQAPPLGVLPPVAHHAGSPYPRVVPSTPRTGGGGIKVEDTAVSPEMDSVSHRMESGKRPRSRVSHPAPAPPRMHRTPYQFFQLGVNKEQLMQLHPDPSSQSSHDMLPRLMSDLWHQMTPEQRKPFMDMAGKDRERYDKEVREHRCRMVEMGGLPQLEGEAEVTTPTVRGGSSNGAAISSPCLPGSYYHASPHPQQHAHGSPSQAPYYGGGCSGSGQMHMGIPVGPTPQHLMRHRVSNLGSHVPTSMVATGSYLPAGMVPAHAHGGRARQSGMAMGMSLLPLDAEAEEVDHLCHYGDGAPAPHFFDPYHHNQYMRSGSSMPGAPSHHNTGQTPDHLDHGLDLDANGVDDFDMAMNSLKCSDGGAAATIDLFGCSAQVQLDVLGTTKAEVEQEENLVMQQDQEKERVASLTKKNMVQQLSGQDQPHASSSAGSPSDVHVSQLGFHSGIGLDRYRNVSGSGYGGQIYISRQNSPYGYSAGGAAGDPLGEVFS